MSDYDPELVKQALAEKDKEIERLNLRLKDEEEETNRLQRLQDKWLIDSVELGKAQDRIAALEAEIAKLREEVTISQSALSPESARKS